MHSFRKKAGITQFDDWISRYHAVLYKHALWMTGNQDIAQEMTQETFYQAWLSRHTLKDMDKALPWLLTILRRAIYRELRCQYRHVETLTQLSLLDQDTTQSDACGLLEIYYALEKLSPKLRETFLLHHLHGFSYEEISAQLEIPMGTVMSRIARAREALQNQHNTGAKNIIQFNHAKRGNRSEG